MSDFFGWHVDYSGLPGQTFALLLALLLGGAVGVERQLRGQVAGLRTHILVAVGSCLITLTSVQMSVGTPDKTRLAAQVVSGIGFLGAGAILRDGMTVHGLTTAASLWAMAAIGIAVGGGPRTAELAVCGAMFVLVTLAVLTRVEPKLRLKDSIRMLELVVRDADGGPGSALAKLVKAGFEIYGVATEDAVAPPDADPMHTSRRMRLRVRPPAQFDRTGFNAELTNDSSIMSFHLE